MVFSSIQAYLDPSNWQQQQNHGITGSTSTNHLLPPPPPPPPPHQPPLPPPSQVPHGGGSIRPGSMSERARLANIPLPEAALKCPRCESTNTKFCYFNNYSLSQPRHFCKTCRRYWTRGGALRNVPVGGGYRRNKRSKSSSSSKSPASGNATASSASNISATSSGGGSGNILGLAPQLPPLRFMSPPLSQLSDGFATDVGLNYSGIGSSPILGSSDQNINFHGSANSLLGHGGMSSLFSSSGIEPWRLHQYPNFFGGGFEAQSSAQGVFNQFQGHDNAGAFMGGETSHIRPPKAVLSSSSSSMMSQLASIKMEDNNISHEMNLSRQLLGGMSMSVGNEQWNNGAAGTNAWTELSSFSSSSTSNPLS